MLFSCRFNLPILYYNNLMNQEELNHYKKVLEERKADLEKELEAVPLVEDMGSDVEGFEDMSEETDEAEQMFNNAAMRQVLKKQLSAVNDALEKIARGEYGECEKCGQKIAKERLNTTPEIKHCQHCQAE